MVIIWASHFEEWELLILQYMGNKLNRPRNCRCCLKAEQRFTDANWEIQHLLFTNSLCLQRSFQCGPLGLSKHLYSKLDEVIGVGLESFLAESLSCTVQERRSVSEAKGV